jgi:hypothetical protein
VDNVIGAPKRVLGIALTWAIVWLAFWTILAGIIAVVDPDSIDPGEGAMFFVLFGPMGLFSGIAFGILLSMAGRGRAAGGLSPINVAALGMLGCALVQLGCLGHGDQGLAANIMMALLFSAVACVVTLGWLLMAGPWLVAD